jgi:hypothetical protein
MRSEKWGRSVKLDWMIAEEFAVGIGEGRKDFERWILNSEWKRTTDLGLFASCLLIKT